MVFVDKSSLKQGWLYKDGRSRAVCALDWCIAKVMGSITAWQFYIWARHFSTLLLTTRVSNAYPIGCGRHCESFYMDKVCRMEPSGLNDSIVWRMCILCARGSLNQNTHLIMSENCSGTFLDVLLKRFMNPEYRCNQYKYIFPTLIGHLQNPIKSFFTSRQPVKKRIDITV